MDEHSLPYFISNYPCPTPYQRAHLLDLGIIIYMLAHSHLLIYQLFHLNHAVLGESRPFAAFSQSPGSSSIRQRWEKRGRQLPFAVYDNEVLESARRLMWLGCEGHHLKVLLGTREGVY